MKYIAAIVLFAVASVPTMAESPSFESLDADSDGMLSVLEAKGAPKIDFFDADINKDGSIDAEEFKIAAAPSDE